MFAMLVCSTETNDTHKEVSLDALLAAAQRSDLVKSLT